MLHKIKINSPLRFTKVVFPCLRLLILVLHSKQIVHYVALQTKLHNYQSKLEKSHPPECYNLNVLISSLRKECFRRHADTNNQNWASTLTKKYNYGRAIQACIVYWGTTYLKEECTPNKIVIKIFIFVEFGTVLLLSET